MPSRLRWRMPANRHQRSAHEGDVGRPVEREQVTHPIPEHQRHVVACIDSARRNARPLATQASCASANRCGCRGTSTSRQCGRRCATKAASRASSSGGCTLPATITNPPSSARRCAATCAGKPSGTSGSAFSEPVTCTSGAKFTQAACAGRVFAERKRERFEEDAAQPRNTGITRRRARAEAPAHQHYLYPCSAGTPDKPGP